MSIDKLDFFVESQPRMCIWCCYCAVAHLSKDEIWGYICVRHCEDITKRVKNAIKPFPVNTDGKRTRVQCVNADESHNCFKPTERTSSRIRLLDEFGLLGDYRKELIG